MGYHRAIEFEVEEYAGFGQRRGVHEIRPHNTARPNGFGQAEHINIQESAGRPD